MKKIIITLIMFLVTVTLSAQTKLPKVFTIDANKIASLRIAYAKGERNDAVKKLLKNANDLLSDDICTIVEKSVIPPSGDKHDFMSMGSYWWPNPDTKDGLPYIRKDGERNPEIKNIPDDENKSKMINAVSLLSQAYYISGDKKYSDQAVKWLRTWFIDKETKMNPNLNFAQFIPGRSQGRGFGIIDTHQFHLLLNGLGLLENAEGIEPDDLKTIKSWFTDFLIWLRTSKNGLEELNAKNNHGCWYDVQVVTIMQFLGDNNSAKEHLQKVTIKRIDSQVEPDGKLPEELERTTSWNYTVFNLTALFNLARLGENVGIDLWNYENPKGGSLRKALDFVIPFTVKMNEWKYKQISEIKKDNLFQLLVMAQYKYDEKIYSEWLDRIFGNKKKYSFQNLIL